MPNHASSIRDSLPQLSYRVDDLRRTSDEELLSREAPSFGKVALVVLKHGVDHPPGLLEFLRTRGGMLKRVKNRDDQLTLFSYIFRVAPVGVDEVLTALGPALEPKTREIAVTAAEQLIAKGREEGRLDGERRTLLRLLDRRFGVTPEVEQRVAAALEPELILWLDRFLDAGSLDEVFRPTA